MAEDRRDCYWLYAVTECNVGQASSLPEETGNMPVPQIHPIKDPARASWHEACQPRRPAVRCRQVKKVDHYYPSVDAMMPPIKIGQGEPPPYGGQE